LISMGTLLGAARGEQPEGLLGQFEELSFGTESPLDRLERRLHPWASYLVLHLFALANAGVTLSAGAIGGAAGSRVTWGIVLGLLIGKAIGVTGLAWVAVRLRVAALPAGVRQAHVTG